MVKRNICLISDAKVFVLPGVRNLPPLSPRQWSLFALLPLQILQTIAVCSHWCLDPKSTCFWVSARKLPEGLVSPRDVRGTKLMSHSLSALFLCMTAEGTDTSTQTSCLRYTLHILETHLPELRYNPINLSLSSATLIPSNFLLIRHSSGDTGVELAWNWAALTTYSLQPSLPIHILPQYDNVMQHFNKLYKSHNCSTVFRPLQLLQTRCWRVRSQCG